VFTPFVKAPVIEFLSCPASSSLQLRPLLPLPGDQRFEKLWKNTLKALIQTWAETHSLLHPERRCCHFANYRSTPSPIPVAHTSVASIFLSMLQMCVQRVSAMGMGDVMWQCKLKPILKIIF
jgi:hypothetical protein